jgi:hypothetical protein
VTGAAADNFKTKTLPLTVADFMFVVFTKSVENI